VSLSYLFPLPIATESKTKENFQLVVLNTALPGFLLAKDSVIVVVFVKGVEKLKWNS